MSCSDLHTRYFANFSQDPAWTEWVQQVLWNSDNGGFCAPDRFKSTIDRLKALKTEMEHLQLLLERVKFKIQKDFQKWWNQETSELQVTDLTSLYLSAWHHHVNLIRVWRAALLKLATLFSYLSLLITTETSSFTNVLACKSMSLGRPPWRQRDPGSFCSSPWWMRPSGRMWRTQIHKDPACF